MNMMSSGFDMVSAVAIGACGIVASAVLYTLSGGRSVVANDTPASIGGDGKMSGAAAKTAASPAVGIEVDGDSKQRKKQRQKLKKQQQRSESATLAHSPEEAKGKAVDDAGAAATGEENAKVRKKKNRSKASAARKSKSTETTDSSEDAAVASAAPEQEIEEEIVEDDGDLQFALAMAGNQKNMQSYQKEQKMKQQKEEEKLQRKKTVEDREKRMLLKKEEDEKQQLLAKADNETVQLETETTVIAIKPREISIILGQSGKVIKQIRQESGAKLDVSKREGDQSIKDRRLLTIVGTSEQIETARTLLRAVFKEEDSKSEVVEVGDKMAAVIGKGGSVIKRIMRDTGATLDAERDTGTIRVSGEPEQIEAAVAAIKKIVAPGDQISMKLNKRQKMLVIGKGGQMIRQIESMTHCQLDVEKTEDGGGLLKIGGDSNQVLEAMTTIQKLFQDASYTVTIACGDLIGAIIGKGGEVIRKIQEDTQVKLDVEMDKKCVEIVGYEKDVKAAKARVEAILACPVEVKPGETKLNVDLAQYVSSVIGRGGQKVRDIEESSGATVKVLGTDCIIVGKQKNVEKAKHLIDEILKKQVDQSSRAEAAKAAVQALSASHTQQQQVATTSGGQIAWGSSAWGNDLAHWTASPVAAATR